jgi:HD-GYP domain-containing protein (c-di-GMP phosphodiesterase class II)
MISLIIGLVFFLAGLSIGMIIASKKSSHSNSASGDGEQQQSKFSWIVLNKFLTSLGNVREEDKIAEFVSRFLKNNLSVRYSAVLFLRGDFFKAISSDGLHQESERNLKLKSNHPLIEYCKSVEGALILDKNNREMKIFKTMLQEKINELLIMAIRVGDEVQGILWVADKEGGFKFSEKDKEFLEYLGHAIGYIYKNNHLINELENRALNIVTGLIKALEHKSKYTRGHSDRVAMYSKLFAKSMDLPFTEIQTVYRAALLHDVGKIGVSDNILNKTGKLTPEEFEKIKTYPILSAELLHMLDFLVEEEQLVKSHQENVDGSGYPKGISGAQIPLGSQIIAMADVFDALTNDQPHRKAFNIEESLTMMNKMRGSKFDPQLLENFMYFVRKQLEKLKFQ